MAIVDLLLVVFKLLGQVPELLAKYQLYKQDSNYVSTSDKLNKAFDEFVVAKKQGNQQAMLDSAWNITHAEKKADIPSNHKDAGDK